MEKSLTKKERQERGHLKKNGQRSKATESEPPF